MVELATPQAVDIKLVACQVHTLFPTFKTTLRNISGFLINKSGLQIIPIL
ncbi:hypothetical protein BSPWISOXPB_4237 [uncultured Gammaproteobacteria bacterium]|nr:hypothetical protein BSPWISOXPB_4237 [uncultured Gammaproteobacteria bacterium]